MAGNEVDFLLLPFYHIVLWYINGIRLAKFGLLIDRTPSIYLKNGLKALASVKKMFVSDKCLHKPTLIGI